MIQKLLFPETITSNDDVFEPMKTKLTVHDLIQKCRDKARTLLQIEEGISDFTANQAAQFKDGRQGKRERKQEKEDALDSWYGMRKQNPDAQEEAALTVMRLRKYLEPGKFYNNDGMSKNPTYYEIGTIEETGPLAKRRPLTRKGKTGTILDEFKGHDESVGFTKRKFLKIQEDRMKTHKDRRYIKLRRAMLKAKIKKTRKGTYVANSAPAAE